MEADKRKKVAEELIVLLQGKGCEIKDIQLIFSTGYSIVRGKTKNGIQQNTTTP